MAECVSNLSWEKVTYENNVHNQHFQQLDFRFIQFP